MPVVRAETFQDAAFLLDETGRIWRIDIPPGGQPIIQLPERVKRHEIDQLAFPLAARAHRS